MQVSDPEEFVICQKGFDIQDILAPYRISLNFPTFFEKKKQIAWSAKIKDKKIVSKRIHVELITSLAKIFKILKGASNPVQSILAIR